MDERAIVFLQVLYTMNAQQRLGNIYDCLIKVGNGEKGDWLGE